MSNLNVPAGYTTTDSGLLVPLEATATSDLLHPTAWLSDFAMGQPVSSRVYVSPQSSLGLSTYYACIRAIAEDCAKLPLQVFHHLEKGREKAPEHWLWPILGTQFNDEMTAFAAREVLTHWALGWGNGYGLILRDQSMTETDGDVIGIYPIHPRRVTLLRDRETGRLLYEIYQDTSMFRRDMPPMFTVDMADMLHLKGPSPDGLLGYSIAQIAAESLGLSLAAQNYGASFFGNNGRPGGILSHPGRLDEKARVNLRESWDRVHSGPQNAGKTALLEEGVTWTPIAIPPEQAQFLETRSFQVREICRWFRMPPSKVGDMSEEKYATIEQQNTDYVVDTLTPWLVRWESEIQMKLLPEEPRYYAKHNVSALLRGDMKARSEYYRALFNVAAYSPNDIREFEELNPYEGGDEYFMQVNMAPVTRIVDGTAQAQPAPSPRAPGEEPEEPDEPETPEAQHYQNGVAHAP